MKPNSRNNSILGSILTIQRKYIEVLLPNQLFVILKGLRIRTRKAHQIIQMSSSNSIQWSKFNFDKLEARRVRTVRVQAGELPGTRRNSKNTMAPTLVLKNEKRNTEIVVIGVAHASPRSNRDVGELIRTYRPNVVFLELCGERHHIINSGSGPREPLPDLTVDVIQEQWRMLCDPVFWTVQLPMLGLEALSGSGIGAEQSIAYTEGVACGARVLLTDRRLSTRIL